VTDIEAWVHTHRGSNPEDITSLNTEEATICLVITNYAYLLFCTTLMLLIFNIFDVIWLFAYVHIGKIQRKGHRVKWTRF
jgi:hypothetical protein